MIRQQPRQRTSGVRATAFARRGWADWIARLIVLDMVLWPGALFVGGSLLVGWQVRDTLPALVAVIAATLFSLAVGVHQAGVMLGVAFAHPARPAMPQDHAGEVSPRPTGRGATSELGAPAKD